MSKIKYVQLSYERPQVERLRAMPVLNLLASLSAEGEFEDFDDGGDL